MCPFDDCPESFGSTFDLVAHLVTSHPDEGSSIQGPNVVGTHLITEFGDPGSAIKTLVKVQKSKGQQYLHATLGDTAQIIQRLPFSGLKSKNAKKPVLESAAKFLGSLTGSPFRLSPFIIPPERRYTPDVVTSGLVEGVWKSGYEKRFDKNNGPLILAATARTSQERTRQAF